MLEGRPNPHEFLNACCLDRVNALLKYRRPIDQGIRIAKKLNTQDVMEMPITAPEAAQ